MKKILLLALLIVACSIVWAKSYYAEDYYCRLDVRENGDIQIRETIQYRFIGGDFSFIERKIPVKYTDGLQFIRALVKTPEGKIVQESNDARASKNFLEVGWSFAPAADTLLNFEVEYIAKRVCYEENGMLYIRWQSVPQSHSYLIKKGSVEMVLPRKIEPIIFLFSEDSRVECGYNENQIWWNFKDLKVMQNFVSGIAVNQGSLAIEKPEWQSLQEQAEGLYADFIRLGIVLILMISALLIYIVFNVISIKRKYSKIEIDEDLYREYPALLQHLKHGFAVNNRLISLIIFRLVSSGMLRVVKENDDYTFYTTENDSENVLEQEVLGMIKDDGISLHELSSQLRSKKKLLGKILLRIQKEKEYADIMSFKSLRRCSIVFTLGILLLFASIGLNMLLVSNGLLWGLFISFGLAYLTIFVGFKSAGIKLFTYKGFRLKYSILNVGKILLQEIEEDSAVLEEDNFDILLEIALLANIQKGFIKLFKNKDVVNSKGLLMNFGNIEELWSFIDLVLEQEKA